jgi:hypothetical protein
MSTAAVSAAFNDDSEDEESKDNTEGAVTSADASRDVEKKLLPDNILGLELVLEVGYFIGEVVEGLYGRGNEWYKAKVGLVTLEGKYNLLYEDGDIENNVSIERIRRIKSVSPKINTEAQNMRISATAAAVSVAFNIDSEDKSNNDNNSNNNNSNTKVAVIPAGVSSDVEKKLLPDNIVVDLKLEVGYFIGEVVEGLYGRGNEWYKAKVGLVTLEGKYNLLYEDGDIEDNVSIERIRKIKSVSPKIKKMEDNNDSGNKGEEPPGNDISDIQKTIDVNEEDHSSSNSIPLSEVLIEGVIPFSADVIPVSADVIPVSADVIPVSADVIPVSADVIPVSADVIPVSADVIPVSGDVIPVSADVIPVSADVIPVSADVIPVSAVDHNEVSTDEVSTDDKICTDTIQSKDVTNISSLIISSGIVTSPDVTDSTSDISKGDDENSTRTNNSIPSSSVVTDQHHVPLVISPLLPPTDDDDDNSDPLDKLLKSLSQKTPTLPCFSQPTSPMRALGTFFSPEQQRQVQSPPTAYYKYANI